MNLDLIFDNVIGQEVDDEIIDDLVEIASFNVMQFKSILLQKNHQTKI
jgi:hypothetical protein